MTMREALEEARSVVASCRNGRIAWPLRLRVNNLLDKALSLVDPEADRLNAELAAAQRTINHLSPSCAALLSRAESAEAELSALKAEKAEAASWWYWLRDNGFDIVNPATVGLDRYFGKE